MKPIQTACFALIASAFVLAGILVVRLDEKAADNAAMADQVLSDGDFSMMTARTRGSGDSGVDSLFILDSRQQTLLIYTPDRKGLIPTSAVKLDELFVESRD